MYRVFDNIGQAVLSRFRGRAPIELLDVCEARLTLSSGNPVPTSSVTAATSVYLTSIGKGNRIKLFDTAFQQWGPRIIDSEKSVAIPSTLFRLFDLFAYWSGSAVALEAVSWNQSTGTITNATAAAPCVITSTSHGLANGDLVGIASVGGSMGTDATLGLNGTVWTVANVAANTFECQGSDTSTLLYTSGGTWYKIPNTRTTALTTQDGVYCKTGDLSRRWLGTGMTTGTSGQCETSYGAVGTSPLWLLWNAYNQVQVELRYGDATDSWLYSTAAFRPMNNRGKLARAGWINGGIAGVNERQVDGIGYFLCNDSASGQPTAALDLDGFAASDGVFKPSLGSPNVTTLIPAPWRGYGGLGFHYLGALEYGGGSTTWYGDGAQPSLIQSALTVRVWA